MSILLQVMDVRELRDYIDYATFRFKKRIREVSPGSCHKNLVPIFVKWQNTLSESPWIATENFTNG